jgi:hypothetical protein
VTRSLGARLALDVPVTPDAETAQSWLEDELSKPVYQDGSGPLDRFAQWLSDLIDRLLNSSSSGGVPVLGYVVGAAVLATLIILAIRFWAPAFRGGRRGADAGVLDDDDRTATQIEAAADAAAKNGDWSLAVLERYRAIVRGAEERVLIDDRPGRTALEAARDIGTALPEHGLDLISAAQTFGAVLYGHDDASADDHAAVAAIARRIAQAKPSLEVSS